MTEFKVGDQVRIKVSTGANSRVWKVGDVTEVSHVLDLGDDVVWLYVGGHTSGIEHLFWDTELELIEEKEERVSKFKEGDRVVKVTKTHFLGDDDYDYGEIEAKQGTVGTVVRHSNIFEGEPYYVDWDNGNSSVINVENLEFEHEVTVLTKPTGAQPERKKVKRKQVDKVLRAAQKANDIYADPQSDYEDYAAACDDLHKILEKIANA